jgi:hypothetical protein
LLAVLLTAAKFLGHSGPTQVALLLAFFIWTPIARIVRGSFLSLREKEYVEAAKASGSGDIRIMFRHMIPNTIGPILVAATLTTGTAILLESVLSFLGFGIPPPSSDWGVQVADHLIVGDAAVSANLGRDVVGCAVADPTVQVRADDRIAVIGQSAGELLVELVPSRHVMHGNNAWMVSIAIRASDIRVNLVAVGAGVRDDTSAGALRSVGAERVPHTVRPFPLTTSSDHDATGRTPYGSGLPRRQSLRSLPRFSGAPCILVTSPGLSWRTR